MFFQRFDVSYLVIAMGLAAVLVAQSWLVKQSAAWLGGLVPAAYAGLIVYLASTARMGSWVDWVLAGIGFFALVSWWVTARRRRTELPDAE